jgi:hypothetical protein
MTINKMLLSALSGIAPTYPDLYEGGNTTYITFNYDTIPSGFGDNEPELELYLIQVHFFCPLGVDSISSCNEIKRKISYTFSEWPEMQNATDNESQHIVFEFSFLMGAG